MRPARPTRVASAWSTLRWYVRGVLREDDYERYVAHLRRHHPDAPAPTVKEFWREKYAAMERDPGARCC